MVTIAHIQKLARIQRTVRWLAAVPLLAACTTDTVPLGGGNVSQRLELGSRCGESPVLDATVRAQSQADLDALAGCEEIAGDLIVQVFEGADLRPLSALRVVGGSFQLGAGPDFGNDAVDEEVASALQAQFDRGIEAGYLPSLEGLESLERTGNLEVSFVTAPSLAVFANLRNIGSHDDASLAGRLTLLNNPNLTDLQGLTQVRGLLDLVLVDNPALEDLEGIVLSEGTRNINILGSPLLTELGELAPVFNLNTLYLVGLGIRNLDELQNLRALGYLEVGENPELENVDGLAQLSNASSLSFELNPKLLRLPAFVDLYSVGSLRALNNAELVSIDLDLPLPIAGGEVVQGEDLETGPSVIEIAANGKLQSISLAAGLTKVQHLAIYDNPSLASIDLGSLRRLDKLSIQDNERLAQIDLGDLQTVDSLAVIDNPLLSSVELGNVRTFESVLSGNAAEPAPVP
jgi:hypothetical protein